ncbi:hypothetical protein DB313_05835 (plasmid) [Borrelia turcica IST7]|uniref:Uncharacterized protein n=1 Tax=Borrelia turcica IST7 TaxID=1104446 RepID=A0A386PQE1_9SPIR|nr:hypothetical protein DB313_05835 [Borrelia turcica IST7]
MFLYLICIFIFCSCNFDGVSKFILPLEDAIGLEISGYERLSDNKFRTRVHVKNYFDSIKDVNGYSYYFILDKLEGRVIMQIKLCSKIASLLDYKFGFIFDFGFKLSFLNINSDSFEFKVEEILQREDYTIDTFGVGDSKLVSTHTFSLKQIREINREFEAKNYVSDINSNTSELMYFVGGTEYSALKEAYIVLYYYVFKAIERFMQE